MSILEQFRATGEVGDDLALLTFRTVRTVAHVYNFPHPTGERWTDPDAVWSAVASFFAEHDGNRRLATLCTQATNDGHLMALLETTVLRWFQTLGRQQERGRLVRALQRVMREEDTVFLETEASKFWALADGPREARSVALDDLVEAAWSVPLDIIRARPGAKNRAPWASRSQQMELLTAVLRAADGAVHMNDIAETVAARVGLLDAPTVWPLDAADVPELATEDVMPIELAGDARELFEQMGPRERIALAYHDAPVRGTAARFGIPRSSLQDAKGRVEEILRRNLGSADVAIVRALRELCEAFAEDRTNPGGLASMFGSQEELP